YFKQWPSADLRLQPFRRNRVAKLQDIVVAPGRGCVLRRCQGGLVIKKPHPECRQSADAAPRASIGAAHLQETLQAYIGEERREVVGPVAEIGLPLGNLALERAVHELTEGHMG